MGFEIVVLLLYHHLNVIYDCDVASICTTFALNTMSSIKHKNKDAVCNHDHVIYVCSQFMR